MVLDNLACGPDPVVVARTTSYADVFGHSDLNVIHVVRVPDRFVKLVGEAQSEDVLHRFLAEVVVDPKNAVRRKHRLDDIIELACGGEVAAEGLLDHDTAPCAIHFVGQPGSAQLFRHLGERLRRDREVEGVITHRAARLVEFLERLLELGKSLVVVEFALHEADALRELLPHILVERRAGVLRDCVVYHLGEVLVDPVTTSESDEREARGE